ncbi:MAG: pilus assembly protein PilM [Gammaproteobacteria bacterium]|nr:pilus assembly protein PilM [Gammaproteobacteria bacterium]
MFSFLKNKRTTHGLAGIELRDDGVSVVHVVRDAGRIPQVTACEFREWGDANEKEKVLARIAADHGLKHARCTTVLDPAEYTLLLTEAPDVPPDELRHALRWRVKDLIDFHVDDATIDVFDVTTPNSPSKTRPMYVVAARNAAIQSRVNLCDNAGIGLDVIDIPELAQRNLASILPEDVRGVVLLVLTARSGLITITRQGEIFLSRRLELGVEALRVADDPAPYFDQIALEIQRSLDYFDSHFRQAHVDQVVLSPSASDLPALVAHLNQNLSIKANVMNLADVVQYDPAYTEQLGDRALLALGAALRQEEKAL